MPRVYLIGYTNIDLNSLFIYLQDTDQIEFAEEIQQAQSEGLDNGEILCSFYAKLCYASLTNKKNKNITKVRAIADNLLSILDTGHGSVLEHCSINFVITDCSRVFTHELVRHRVGTAFSQTSGRYVRNDVLKIVFDPILKPVENELEILRQNIEKIYKDCEEKLGLNQMTDFTKKKKLTSALRRFMPNGQINEIGLTLNIRTARQTIEARTSRHAEWEIRVIFNHIYYYLKEKYKIMFVDAKEEMVDGLNEITFKNKKI